jgi:hypothetical protein
MPSLFDLRSRNSCSRRNRNDIIGPMLQEALIENRLATLEREMAELKSRLPQKMNWLEQVSGSMANEPDFERVLELGRAARQADKLADDGTR